MNSCHAPCTPVFCYSALNNQQCYNACHSPQRTAIEPIFQIYIKLPNYKYWTCNSDKCNSCLTDYFETALHRGYSQINQTSKETIKIGKPNAIIVNPNVTITDEQMRMMQDEALNKFRDKNEIRKRMALLQTNEGVYIIGGYNINPETSTREIPKNDYFYDAESTKLIPILPTPGDGRMGFGLATDGEKIVVVGGHNLHNDVLSTVCMYDTKVENSQWESLPDMPGPTSGSGVSVIDNILYVLGGFEFIGQETVIHGDVLYMNLDERKWHRLPDLNSPRAHVLVTVMDENDTPWLVAAGGYQFNKRSSKPIPYAKMEKYNEAKRKWEHITDIPGFQIHRGLTMKDNKFFLTELHTDEQTGVTDNTIIEEFDFETKKWKKPKPESNLMETTARSKDNRKQQKQTPQKASRFDETMATATSKETSDREHSRLYDHYSETDGVSNTFDSRLTSNKALSR
ncbi:unnamed protein product [Didymodactylos carnosus]|uniref:Uncharacterized protein n=1 Tax=Didymodactylos carnosus TaxID=1234261 RepID=A0A8S2HLS7_9BILA|nr:unnamed protein product [Didymodactylos carnosus]CAF3659190.1 unnamed protein product [Didymodactylos carnosus]